jgi:hypothetical protein
VAAPVTEWRRNLRPLLATFALVYLIVMVVSGAMPVQRQLVRFEPKGVLKMAPERIARVEVSRGTQRLMLLRTGDQQWTTAGGTDIGPAGSRVSMAVQMMHTSGPVREMAEAELVGVDTTPFGLDPPQLAATLYDETGGPVLTARFGVRNPEEYLQYMRLDGDARLYLMSRFVGEEWDRALSAVIAR